MAFRGTTFLVSSIYLCACMCMCMCMEKYAIAVAVVVVAITKQTYNSGSNTATGALLATVAIVATKV